NFWIRLTSRFKQIGNSTRIKDYLIIFTERIEYWLLHFPTSHKNMFRNTPSSPTYLCWLQIVESNSCNICNTSYQEFLIPVEIFIIVSKLSALIAFPTCAY